MMKTKTKLKLRNISKTATKTKTKNKLKRKSHWCKADGMRQEVDFRDEVMHSEMSDWWFLENKM